MNHHSTMDAHPSTISAAGARELAKEPICGMMVDKATALTSQRGGRTYYFCSAQCQRTPANGTMSVTVGSPGVSVPVLSNTTTFSFLTRSRTSAPRITMPASAPLPTPTMSAAGVATPSAQGQEMMRTAMKASKACGK